MKKIILLILIGVLNLNTINAQCYSDRHSTTWFDGWVSCETSPNPISSYGSTHWILYDLGYVYTLFDSKFWNTNEPNHLDNGMMDYSIDYSIDGNTWTNLGSYTLSQASGISTYEGVEGPVFNGTSARYLLITPSSNYGGSCYGFSEFKVYLDDTVSIVDEAYGFGVLAYPNPFTDEIQIKIDTLYPDEPIKYSITDILGKTIIENTISNNTETNTFSLPNNKLRLSSGIYLLNIYQNNKKQTIKIVKK
jgi:hypothetical protein